MPRPKLLLLGWSGADFSVLSPLVDAGHLPHLESLWGRGISGDLISAPPYFSPTLWSTIATGRLPADHGVLDLFAPDPLTGGLRPSGASRAVPALWNHAQAAGLRCHVIGWPGLQPAEETGGVCVTEPFFLPAAADPAQPWPVPAGQVLPARCESSLADFRLHPGELSGTDLLAFVPELERVDQERDPGLVHLAMALADTISRHAVTTWTLEHEPWDAVLVQYPLYARLAPRFLAAHQQPGALYGQVMTGALQLLDAMLGRLLEQAGADAHVLLAAEFGLRPPPATTEPGDTTPRLHAIGWLAMAGPGCRQDELLHGAAATDVLPTALALLGVGLPAALPGQVLTRAFTQPPSARRAPDAPAGGEQSAPLTPSDLLLLGYADPLAAEPATWRSLRLREQGYRGVAHLAAGELPPAAACLQAVVDEEPELVEARLALAFTLLQQGRWDACAEQLAQLGRIAPGEPHLLALTAALCLRQGRLDEARTLLATVEETSRPAPLLASVLGSLHLQQQNWERALHWYQMLAAAVPGDPHAHYGAAVALFRLERFEEAVLAALDAVARRHHQPAAHHLLGAALSRLERWPEAAAALRQALAQDPAREPARRLLAEALTRTAA